MAPVASVPEEELRKDMLMGQTTTSAAHSEFFSPSASTSAGLGSLAGGVTQNFTGRF